MRQVKNKHDTKLTECASMRGKPQQLILEKRTVVLTTTEKCVLALSLKTFSHRSIPNTYMIYVTGIDQG